MRAREPSTHGPTPAAGPSGPAGVVDGPGWRMLRRVQAGPFRITQKQYGPQFRQGVHAHEAGTVDFNLAGGGAGTYGGRPVECRPGVVELYAPGREHSFSAGPAGIRTLHVVFGPGTIPGRALEGDEPAGRQVDQASAVGLAVRLVRELADPDASSPLSIEALAHELLAAASRWRDKAERGARWLRWVRERLHAGGEPSLTELSQLAGVHRAHLARSFSAQYGVSVGEYHRRLRLGAAAAVLGRGTVPLARLARESGFTDQSHLTRWFTRVLGVTPGAYARAMRGERAALNRQGRAAG